MELEDIFTSRPGIIVDCSDSSESEEHSLGSSDSDSEERPVITIEVPHSPTSLIKGFKRYEGIVVRQVNNDKKEVNDQAEISSEVSMSGLSGWRRPPPPPPGWTRSVTETWGMDKLADSCLKGKIKEKEEELDGHLNKVTMMFDKQAPTLTKLSQEIDEMN